MEEKYFIVYNKLKKIKTCSGGYKNTEFKDKKEKTEVHYMRKVQKSKKMQCHFFDNFIQILLVSGDVSVSNSICKVQRYPPYAHTFERKRDLVNF